MQFTTVCSSNHTLRHLNRCQQMLVRNERNTKTILRQWAEVSKTDLLHSFLVLCSIGSPYFLFVSFLSRGCIRVRLLRLNFLTFQKTSTQLLTTHFLTSGPLLYSYSSNARPCQFGCFNTQKPKWRNGPHRVIPD